MNKVEMIHDAAMEILCDVGIMMESEEARKLCKDNGLAVNGNIVYFTESQVWHWLKMAPSSFTIYAQNPKYNVTVGGREVNYSPTYGSAFVLDRDNSVRPGNMKDFVKFVKMVHGLDEYSINGGPLVAPNEIPANVANVAMFYATLINSDKALLITPGDRESVDAIMKAGCEFFGGKETFMANPRMFMLINTVSPLTLSRNMLDCMITLASYGQPVIVSPASMLGTTSPIHIAGTLASNTAEALAGICLAQMVNPGTPVVFGIQSASVDMKTVSFAAGSPEGAVMHGFGAELARFYGLPSRGGRTDTDSPIINVQAGYESMLCAYSAYIHGINLVLVSGGMLGGCNLCSFDKLLVDAEIIHQVQAACTPFEVNEETLCMEEIRECGHKADFLACESTLDHCHDLYNPSIGTRGNTMTDELFKETLEKRTQEVLKKAATIKPAYDSELMKGIKKILHEGSGIDLDILDTIEDL